MIIRISGKSRSILILTVSWWDNREEININGFDKAKQHTLQEIENRNIISTCAGTPMKKRRFCRQRN